MAFLVDFFSCKNNNRKFDERPCDIAQKGKNNLNNPVLFLFLFRTWSSRWSRVESKAIVKRDEEKAKKKRLDIDRVCVYR